MWWWLCGCGGCGGGYSGGCSGGCGDGGYGCGGISENEGVNSGKSGDGDGNLHNYFLLDKIKIEFNRSTSLL